MRHHKKLRVNPSLTFCEVQKRQIMFIAYMRDTLLLICEIPLLARVLGQARATIGYLVYRYLPVIQHPSRNLKTKLLIEFTFLMSIIY